MPKKLLALSVKDYFGTRKIFILSTLALQRRHQGIFSSRHAEGLRSISNRVPWRNAQVREMPPNRIRSIDWTALQPRWRHLGSLWHVRLPPGQKIPALILPRWQKIRGSCVHARSNARNSDDRRHAGSTEVRRCLRVAWPSNLARVRAFFSLFCHLLKLETLTVLRQMSQTWPPRCHVKTKGEGRVGHTWCLKTV